MRWLLAAVLLVPTGLASAQEPDGPGACVDLGRQAMEVFADDPARAHALFERAHAMCPSDAIRFNIGVSLQRLERFREAADHFDALIASADFSEAQRAEVATRLAAVRAELGGVRVIGPPDPIEVRIDDALRCATPCELRLDPGSHTAATARRTERFVITRGETTELDLRDAAVSAPTVTPEAEAASMGRPSALTVIGASVAGIGIGGVIGFGLRSDDLHAEFLRAGQSDPALADDGALFTGLANGSIAAAAVGGVLILIDLLIER